MSNIQFLNNAYFSSNVGIGGEFTPSARLDIREGTREIQIGVRGGDMNIFSLNSSGAKAPIRFEASEFEFVTGAATFASDVTSSGFLRVLSSFVATPSSGTGLEIRNVSGTSSLISYDRDNSFYKPITIDGYDITFKRSGNNALTISATGAATFASSVSATEGNFTGLVTMTDRLDLNDSLNNTFIGDNSGLANSSGNFNTGLGYRSLFSNTTGYGNVAIGVQSLNLSTEGNLNIAIGYQSLSSNTLGGHNIALGYQGLSSNTLGIQNISLGFKSLLNNLSGGYNSVIGVESLSENTTGSFNNAFGYQAGKFITNGTTANSTGYNSIFIGKETRANADGETNQIVIGDTAIGNGSNTVTLGNNSITDTYLKGDVQGSGAATFVSNVSTAKTFISTSIGSANPSANLNELRVNGYGLIGNRGSVYITNSNANGSLLFGIGGAHNDNTELTISGNGATFTSSVSATDGLFSGNLGLGITIPVINPAFDRILHIHSTSGSLIKLTDDTSGSGVLDGFEMIQVGTTTFLTNRENGAINFATNGTQALQLKADQSATFASSVSAGGNVDLGNETDTSMSSSADGQLKIKGQGYSGAIALDASAMYIYHNSSGRNLVLGTNETPRLTITGSTGAATFASSVSATDGLFSGEVVFNGDSENKIYRATTSPITGATANTTVVQGRGVDIYALDDVNIQAGAADKITFKAGGAEALRLNSDQSATFASSVGIGTSTPSTNLEVNDPSTPKIRLGRGSSFYWDIGHTASNFQIESQTAGVVLDLNYSGAATFASSVTATDGLFSGNGVFGAVRKMTLSAEDNASTGAVHRFNIASAGGEFKFSNSTGDILTLNLNKSATFASSVTANGTIRTNSGNQIALNSPNNTAASNIKTNSSNEIEITGALGGKLKIGANATFTSSVSATDVIIPIGTTNKLSRQKLYIGGSGVSGDDISIYIGNDGDGGGYGYEMFYKGSGSGNDNSLIFKSENLGNPVDALELKQDGAATFASSVSAGSSFISTVPQSASYYTNMRTVYSYNESFVLEHKGTKLITFSDSSPLGMRFNSSGGVFNFNGGAAIFASDILVGKTVSDDTVTGAMVRSMGLISASRDGNVSGIFNRNSTTGSLVLFRQAGTQVGSIYVSGSATAYNTNSDYRLKEDLKDFNGLEMISNIPVYDYKWKVDESRSYGVMAHELQEILPNAVSGEKDAEEMQGVDYSKIVPLLIKSIQELKAEVELLKRK